MSRNYQIGLGILMVLVIGMVSSFNSWKIGKEEIPIVDYLEVKDYIVSNITEILLGIEQKPANGKWFATKLEFTSGSSVYVDFEDGHFGFRALLECTKATKFSCSVVAVFESDKTGWYLISGTDTANGKPVTYVWSLD